MIGYDRPDLVGKRVAWRGGKRAGLRSSSTRVYPRCCVQHVATADGPSARSERGRCGTVGADGGNGTVLFGRLVMRSWPLPVDGHQVDRWRGSCACGSTNSDSVIAVLIPFDSLLLSWRSERNVRDARTSAGAGIVGDRRGENAVPSWVRCGTEVGSLRDEPGSGRDQSGEVRVLTFPAFRC